MAIRRKDLWLDADQGVSVSGTAFGFIGCDADSYQGWFFDWPRESTGIESVAEREKMLDSLNADTAVGCGDEQIPYRWARKKLDKWLRAQYGDMRRKR